MWLIANVISLLTTNLVLTKALGTSTLMAAAKSKSNLLILALVMTGFSMLCCLLTSLAGMVIPFGQMTLPAALLMPMVFALIVCAVYLIVLLGLYSLAGSKFSVYKKYIHLSALNCAVMGTLYLGFTRNGSGFQPLPIAEAVAFGLQSGLGFVLAALLLTAVRSRLYAETVPASFRGFPAVMVYIGLLSMAVYAITV